MSIKVISADRPSDNEELAWLIQVRRRLSTIQRLNFDFGDFVECDACAAKPGMPDLCGGCLANRYLFINLKRLK